MDRNTGKHLDVNAAYALMLGVVWRCQARSGVVSFDAHTDARTDTYTDTHTEVH